MKKSVYVKILGKLRDKKMQEEFTQAVTVSMSRGECAKSHSARTVVAAKVGFPVTSLWPNEHFSKDDVAFGLLSNGEFITALDFKTDIDKGYISHSSMLVGLGYAKSEDDANPRFDFVARGIVKASLNRDVVFWETPKQITDDPKTWAALQKICRLLLKSGIVSKSTRVFGGGNDIALGEIAALI